MIKCLICNREFKDKVCLSQHISRNHKESTSQEYYDKYLNTEDLKCPHCDNKRKFIRFVTGYRETCCSKECHQKQKDSNFLKKYGVKNPNQLQEVKNKKAKKCLETYGVDNNFKSKEIQEISKHTKKENYGDENYNNPLKRKETCLEKYNVINPGCLESTKIKRNATRLERYGDEHYVNDNLAKHTKKERYGDENYNNRPEAIKTSQKLYNTDYPSQSNVIKIKKINTSLLHYNVIHPWKSSIIKEQIKRTNLKNIGVENYSQSKEFKNLWKDKGFIFSVMLKRYESQKKNGTFNTSKPEAILYNLLCELFNNNNVEKQYHSEQYPFNCDFYIKSLDLYIEYNGSWTHGFKPFDIFKVEHINRIKEMVLKSNELNFKNKPKQYYTNAIKVWTESDVKKRETAKQNNLNYIEIFNNNCFINLNNILDTYKGGYLCLI